MHDCESQSEFDHLVNMANTQNKPSLGGRVPKGSPTTLFVSSTCYDLSQIRIDLRDFAISLGYEPVLSEFSTFPVNPSIDAVKNCLEAVRNRADSLALHRIVAASVSAMSFQRPADFSLDKFDDDGRFGFGDGKKIKLKFRIAKAAGQHLLESPLAADQLVKELADGYEISATVVETEQLKWWLRGFGTAVSAITPARLLM